jgi:ribosome-binding factor A
MHKDKFCFTRCMKTAITILTFTFMSTIRQSRIEGVIQEELSMLFQRNARDLCLGAMVTVTIVRVSPDLSSAKCYLSIFAGPPKDEVLKNVELNAARIRGDVGRRLKNMKHIPSLSFYIDDSLDYATKINELLKKG